MLAFVMDIDWGSDFEQDRGIEGGPSVSGCASASASARDVEGGWVTDTVGLGSESAALSVRLVGTEAEQGTRSSRMEVTSSSLTFHFAYARVLPTASLQSLQRWWSEFRERAPVR